LTGLANGVLFRERLAAEREHLRATG